MTDDLTQAPLLSIDFPLPTWHIFQILGCQWFTTYFHENKFPKMVPRKAVPDWVRAIEKRACQQTPQYPAKRMFQTKETKNERVEMKKIKAFKYKETERSWEPCPSLCISWAGSSSGPSLGPWYTCPEEKLSGRSDRSPAGTLWFWLGNYPSHDHQKFSPVRM